MRLIERETQAEHSRALFPAVDQAAALRTIQREIPQYRQPVGVLTCGLDRQLVGIGVPSRRMDHGRIDARFIHFLQEIIL